VLIKVTFLHFDMSKEYGSTGVLQTLPIDPVRRSTSLIVVNSRFVSCASFVLRTPLLALGREVLGTSQVGPENMVGLEGLLICAEKARRKKFMDGPFFPSLIKVSSSGKAISINRTTWANILQRNGVSSKQPRAASFSCFKHVCSKR